MTAIPSSALERYRRLRRRSEDDRAAYIAAGEAAAHERAEVGRLEAALQAHQPGRRLDVDDAGTVSWTEEVRGQPYRSTDTGSHVAVGYDLSSRRNVVKPTPELAREVGLLLGARGRLAEAVARQAETSRKGQGVRALAHACEALLRERGWTPSGLAEVRGLPVYEVAR